MTFLSFFCKLSGALVVLALAVAAGGCRWIASYDRAAGSDGAASDRGAPTDGPSKDGPSPSAPRLTWRRVFHGLGDVEVGGVAVDAQERRYVVGRFKGRLAIEGATPRVVEAPADRYALFVYRYPSKEGQAELWSRVQSANITIDKVHDAVIAGKWLVVALSATVNARGSLSTTPWLRWFDIDTLDRFGLTNPTDTSEELHGMSVLRDLAAHGRRVAVAAEGKAQTQGRIVVFDSSTTGPTERARFDVASTEGKLQLRAVALTGEALLYAVSGEKDDDSNSSLQVTEQVFDMTGKLIGRLDRKGVKTWVVRHPITSGVGATLRSFEIQDKDDVHAVALSAHRGQGACHARLLTRKVNSPTALQLMALTIEASHSRVFRAATASTIAPEGESRFALVQGAPATAAPDTWVGAPFDTSATSATIKSFGPGENEGVKEGPSLSSPAVTQSLALIPGASPPTLLAAGRLPAWERLGASLPALSGGTIYWGEVDAALTGGFKRAGVAGGTARFAPGASALQGDGTLWLGGLVKKKAEASPRGLLVAYDEKGNVARAIAIKGQRKKTMVQIRALAFDDGQLVVAVKADGAFQVRDVVRKKTFDVTPSRVNAPKPRTDVLWIPLVGTTATLRAGARFKDPVLLAARDGKAALVGHLLDTKQPGKVDVLVRDRADASSWDDFSYGVSGDQAQSSPVGVVFEAGDRLLVATNLSMKKTGEGDFSYCDAAVSLTSGQEVGLLTRVELKTKEPCAADHVPLPQGETGERPAIDSLVFHRPTSTIVVAGRYKAASSKKRGYVALLERSDGTLGPRWVKTLRSTQALDLPVRLAVDHEGRGEPELRLGLVHRGALKLWDGQQVSAAASSAALTIVRLGEEKAAVLWRMEAMRANSVKLHGLEVHDQQTTVLGAFVGTLTLPTGEALDGTSGEHNDLVLRFAPQ